VLPERALLPLLRGKSESKRNNDLVQSLRFSGLSISEAAGAGGM
jgi:hypothetical protein